MSDKDLKKRYCPSDYVHREDLSGNIIPGLWRKEITNLQPLGRVGSNTYNKNTDKIRETLAFYFAMKVQCRSSGINNLFLLVFSYY